MYRGASMGAALMLALLSGACLFQPRDANPPDTGGSNAIALEFPQDVFTAIKVALEGLADANYERAVSEDFIFSPTQEDSLDQNFIGTGAFDNWTKSVELQVVQLLITESASIKVSFTPSQLINENTFVRFRAGYVLTVISRAVPPDTTEYRGVSHIDVRNEGGNWRATYWKDTEADPGYSSWGFLRGTLRRRLSP